MSWLPLSVYQISYCKPFSLRVRYLGASHTTSPPNTTPANSWCFTMISSLPWFQIPFSNNLISTPVLFISFYLIKVLLTSYSRCSPNFSSHSTSMASVTKMCSPQIKEKKDTGGYIYNVNFKNYKKYSPLARRQSLSSVTVKHKLAGWLLI